LDEDLKRRIGIDLHLCWFPDCKAVWRIEEATYCSTCDTYSCPKCRRCFCDLPPLVQYVLDAEMASLGLWDPYSNPRRRKKRGPRIKTWVFSRPDFEWWAKEHFPELYSSYERGEISFSQLVHQLQGITGRTIIVR